MNEGVTFEGLMSDVARCGTSVAYLSHRFSAILWPETIFLPTDRKNFALTLDKLEKRMGMIEHSLATAIENERFDDSIIESAHGAIDGVPYLYIRNVAHESVEKGHLNHAAWERVLDWTSGEGEFMAMDELLEVLEALRDELIELRDHAEDICGVYEAADFQMMEKDGTKKLDRDDILNIWETIGIVTRLWRILEEDFRVFCVIYLNYRKYCRDPQQYSGS